MAVIPIKGRLAIVRLIFDPAGFPSLLREHSVLYPDGRKLESQGRALIDSGFRPASVVRFVRNVCNWGGGDRFVDRVLARNAPEELSRALREGYTLACKDQVPEGVARIARLDYLGLSFASKQLRFLVPSRAVILDSIIRSRLGYPETEEGYREFLADCRAILDHMRKSGLGRRLRVCDIEAALFVTLRGR